MLQLKPPNIKEPKKYINPKYKKIKLVKGLRMKLKMKINMITIINCYTPHSQHTKKKPEDTEKFYENLDKFVNKYKNKSSIVIVAGDMNANVGKKMNETFTGRYSKGYKNDNGDYPINFCQ